MTHSNEQEIARAVLREICGTNGQPCAVSAELAIVAMITYHKARAADVSGTSRDEVARGVLESSSKERIKRMTDTAWLLEWPADRQMPVRYWHPTEGHVIDPKHALRFARREDAEMMRKRDHLMGTRAVEHQWLMNDTSATSREHVARPYPELLSNDEQREMLTLAEQLWSDLQDNNLGGFSGCNRPFYILHEFHRVIEQYGHRDTGLHWSKDQLDAALTPSLPVPE